MNKKKSFLSFVTLFSTLTFANEFDISVNVVKVEEKNIYTVEVLGLEKHQNVFESEEKDESVFLIKNMVVKTICNKKNANKEIEVKAFNEYAEGLFVGKINCSK